MHKLQREKRRSVFVSCFTLVLLLVMVTGSANCLAEGAAPLATPGPTMVPPLTQSEIAVWEAAELEGSMIVTNYITLVSPEMFDDAVSFLVIEMGEDSAIVASVMEREDLMLYAILLSKTEMDGIKVGELQLEEGERIGLYLQMAEYTEDTPEYENICFCQESVNDLLEQLMADPRYVPAA